MTTGSRFGDVWDRYVDGFDHRKAEFSERYGRDIEIPGDEWGSPVGWRRRTESLFGGSRFGDEGCKLAIELGPGSGKYTRLFLETCPDARVIACDVSSRFLDILQEQSEPEIASGRLIPKLLDSDHRCLDTVAAEHGAVGSVDCVFSIDAMVHVGLQYLVAYWLSAHRILRPGGLLIMGVADATTDMGFEKLIRDVPSYFDKQGGGAFGQFEWLSAELVQDTLRRVGFEPEIVDAASSRDCYFVARRVEV